MRDTTNDRRTRTGARVLASASALTGAVLIATTPAAASTGDVVLATSLQSQMETVGRFLSIVIAAVAIPNGAFGVFQYMTAGTDTEQSEKGRKRIRNSFVGVAGAGAIVIAVQLLTSMLGVPTSGGSPDLEPMMELQMTMVSATMDAQLALLQVVPGL